MRAKKTLLAILLTASTLLGGCQQNKITPDVMPKKIRFATFNISFDRNSYSTLVKEMSTPSEQQGARFQQPRNIAEILQRVRPDVVLLNEFNNDGSGKDMRAINGFRANYLAVSQNGAEPVSYPYAYNFATNTGKQIKGMDLNKDGKINEGPDDALGFGRYHGQYAFAVLSRYPLDESNLRTFRHFKWKDIRPQNPVITDKESCQRILGRARTYCEKRVGKPWYSDFEWNNIPMSAKNHADLPIQFPNGQTIHFLISHPTPSMADNPVQHNTLHNLDEVKFWADYISDSTQNRYIYDDNRQRGGLSPEADFVIAGDLNADPVAGDGKKDAIKRLLNHKRINPQVTGNHSPVSRGAVEYVSQGVDCRETSYPERITHIGNLHLDYVLPSSSLKVTATGVFWPDDTEKYGYLVKKPYCRHPENKNCYGKEVSSDHRLVWVDIAL
ncbi:hypothetical protein CI610_00873 [invertebrate metagenome]|uniref:Endonuclease/exonuclease/phosphatase domain-containing protein n=1 Tax=invertebrate metagenome TaxID=1711999 RepID=A0A2H9TAK2_9ZZZZ